MKLSKRSRYGLRALIDLTVNSQNEHMALSSIAERNEISPQYLEQVFASLRRAGIVKSIKGPQGGYLLNREPEEIPVSEILEVLDGTYWVEEEDVREDSSCRGISDVIQKLVIDEVNRKLDTVLRNLTLEDLKKEYTEYNQYSQHMYYI